MPARRLRAGGPGGRGKEGKNAHERRHGEAEPLWMKPDFFPKRGGGLTVLSAGFFNSYIEAHCAACGNHERLLLIRDFPFDRPPEDSQLSKTRLHGRIAVVKQLFGVRQP
jgi:hypothetical protein